MYHLLRREGCSVDYLVYDSSIPITETTTQARELAEGPKFWQRSVQNQNQMLKAARVPFQTISCDPDAEKLANSAGDLEQLLDYKFDDVDFGSIVFGALCRYYKSTQRDDANVTDVARRVLTTALTNYLKIQRLCAKEDYDLVMFSHGIYMTWEPVAEFCRREEIDFACYGRAKTAGHFTFNTNQPTPDWSFDAAWERYHERELTTAEQKRALDYLKDRETQKGDYYSYNSTGRENNLDNVRDRLGIPSEAKLLTICTNLIWDAANASRDLIFDSMLDCVYETMQHFAARQDVHVLLRTHPAEEILGTDERYADLLISKFGGSLPDNVTVLDHSAEVNSFTVIDLTDIAIVNTSTVGLEMALLGRPTLVVGETHYRGKGFTIDPISKDLFFSQLDEALSIDRPVVNTDLALKYFYMMMFQYQLKMPEFLTSKPTNVQLLKLLYSQKSVTNQEELHRVLRTLAIKTPPDLMDWKPDHISNQQWTGATP